MPRSAYQLFGDYVGGSIGGRVGKVFGDTLGQALEGRALGASLGGLIGGPSGAAKGAAIGSVVGGVSSLAGALKGAGGSIGAAAGKASPYIAAVVAGFEIGTAIGGLLKSKPSASARITSADQKAVTYGNNGTSVDNVKQSVDSVQSGINKIADALGATLGSFNVSIGSREDYFRVLGNGGDAGAKYTPGALYNGKDASEAIRIAIKDAIDDGAIQGIRQGAQNLIRTGLDLETQINKALKFQNVFDRLKQRTDPVGFAVDQLNKEFTGLIKIFKEAGASSQEYADLEKLYGLERADAIKNATTAVSDAIDQFLKDMVGSSSSPLNKLDTYNNASKDLNAYRGDISSGKAVDQNALLSAARNFQDASRNLNGSGQAFFDDFNALRDLLTKARDNAGVTNVTTLPGSPLAADSTVQAEIAKLTQSGVNATVDQTAVLGTKLDLIYGALSDLNQQFDFGSLGSSIRQLPGFNHF